eukprot:565791-Hanusia_phi.AAC.3
MSQLATRGTFAARPAAQPGRQSSDPTVALSAGPCDRGVRPPSDRTLVRSDGHAGHRDGLSPGPGFSANRTRRTVLRLAY